MLDDEDAKIYELSIAQVDSYEIRCRASIQALYEEYLTALREIFATCKAPIPAIRPGKDPDAGGSANPSGQPQQPGLQAGGPSGSCPPTSSSSQPVSTPAPA